MLLSKLKGLFFSVPAERRTVSELVDSIGIKTAGLSQQVKYLSGGNKQKVVFGKWLTAGCNLLILDEPTIGIDVGARGEIYELIRRFVDREDRAVIFISSDMDEILEVADRILVMSGRQLVAELDPKHTDEAGDHAVQPAGSDPGRGGDVTRGASRPEVAARQARASASGLRGLFRNQGISMLVILVVMWVVLAFLSPYFFTVDNLFEITLQTAVIAIIAAGETFVIISGGIDLSVGSVFACSAVVGGLVFTSTQSLALALAATVAVGALFGLTNGLLITKVRVPPFIATLGMMGIARGLALISRERHPHLRAGRRLQVHRPGQAVRRDPRADGHRAGGLRHLLRGHQLHALRPVHLRHRQQHRGGAAVGHQRAAGARSASTRSAAC